MGGAAMAEAVGRAAGRRPHRTYVRWSEAVAERLLARLADGEFLYRIARDADMPTPEAVAKWAKARPEFGARLDAARRAGGRPPGSRGPVTTYYEAMGEEIFQRVCEGEALTRIGQDPTMPSVWTIFRWRNEQPAFDRLIHLGMRIRAERFCDIGWEMAEAATPETAYLTQVQLNHLRWTAGVMAPSVFRARPAEPEKPQKVRTILFRHFEVEADKATGKRKVIAYCPNPYTGQVEREDTPGWVQPGDKDTFSMPGGRPAGQGWRPMPERREG